MSILIDASVFITVERRGLPPGDAMVLVNSSDAFLATITESLLNTPCPLAALFLPTTGWGRTRDPPPTGCHAARVCARRGRMMASEWSFWRRSESSLASEQLNPDVEVLPNRA